MSTPNTDPLAGLTAEQQAAIKAIAGEDPAAQARTRATVETTWTPPLSPEDEAALELVRRHDEAKQAGNPAVAAALLNTYDHAIEHGRELVAKGVKAPPPPDTSAADAAVLATHERLKIENPYGASLFRLQHDNAISRALARKGS